MGYIRTIGVSSNDTIEDMNVSMSYKERLSDLDRARSLAMRLSYSYVEPELMDEGLRRIAAAAHELGARPVRSASVPI